jgi:cell division protein FtsQ
LIEPPDSPAPSGPKRLPLVIAGAAAAVLVAVWLVAFSPALGVRTVQVSGIHTLTADQVRTAAEIDDGAPLIRLDTAGVRKRVEAMPDVASASVSVSYPSTIKIQVVERVPIGYLANGASSFSLVDRTGAQYREVTAAPAGLPRFAIPVGAGGQETGQAVAVVAAALDPPVLALLAQISADSPQSITLVLRDGRTVSWGSAERSDQKAALLPTLLAQPGKTYDVSSPSLAVVR